LLVELTKHNTFAVVELGAGLVLLAAAFATFAEQAGIAGFGQGLIRVWVVVAARRDTQAAKQAAEQQP
jgi:hypothetical protein